MEFEKRNLSRFTVGNVECTILGCGGVWGDYVVVTCEYRVLSGVHEWDNINIAHTINYHRIVRNPNFLERLFGITYEKKTDRAVRFMENWLRSNMSRELEVRSLLETKECNSGV